MTLREYINNLNELVNENPETLDCDVVYARDDEGNGYQKIWSTPSIFYWLDGEIYSEEDFESRREDEEGAEKVVVIN